MDEDIKKIVSEMTLKEKADMTSGKNFWESEGVERLGIRSMFFSDGPNGLRKQAVGADHLGLNESIKSTCFPSLSTIAASWNDELAYEVGQCIGKEAQTNKVSVLLGPGINMKRNPRCGRNFEYFSEDPFLAGHLAANYIKGAQSNGISACVKHFCCNNQEEKRMTIDTVVDERTLREIYLTAFEIVVKDANPHCIMSSYNMVNGTHTNENKHLTNDILRGEWSYQGVMVTDWGGENNRIEGLEAGNELEMPGSGGDTQREVEKAVLDGKLAESILDENVGRLLNLEKITREAVEKGDGNFDIEGHHKVAQDIAKEGMVLLKNQHHILPLKKGLKVAIIGDFAENPRYQGAGSSKVNPTKLDTTLDVIKEYDEIQFVGYEKGFDRYGKKNKKLAKKAMALAEKADVVLLYTGLDEVTEAEGLDRPNINFPQNQADLAHELAHAGHKVVALVFAGSSVKLGWADECDALLFAYLPGQAGARAALDLVTGRDVPSGKLAETFPFKYHDCSSKNNFPGKEKTVEYRESIYIGYRYYDTASVSVKYPFGYGLSYTTFAYSDYEVNEKGVSFTIENTGDYDGKEIAELYVSMVNGKVFRPVKELKGYKKVFIKKGEKVKVEIPFDDMTFRYFNVKTKKWEVEGGIYSIMIGASSRDIRLCKTLEIEGTHAENPYDPEKLPSYYSGEVASVPNDEFKELLGHDIPKSTYDFMKKNRIKVGYNTTVNELQYAKGWFGRFFSWAIRFAIKFMKAFGNVNMANTLIMGMLHQPMRGISRMTGGMIPWESLDGMILMFNGHFFKGASLFFKGKKNYKKMKKAEAEAKKKAGVEEKKEEKK